MSERERKTKGAKKSKEKTSEKMGEREKMSEEQILRLRKRMLERDKHDNH